MSETSPSPCRLPSLSELARRQKFRSYRLDLAGVAAYKRKLRKDQEADPGEEGKVEAASCRTEEGEDKSAATEEPHGGSSNKKKPPPKRVFGIIDRFNADEKARKERKEQEKNQKQNSEDPPPSNEGKDGNSPARRKMNQADQNQQVERLTRPIPVPKPPPRKHWKEVLAEEPGMKRGTTKGGKNEGNAGAGPGPPYKSDEAFADHFYKTSIEKQEQRVKKLNARYAETRGRANSPRGGEARPKSSRGTPHPAIVVKCASEADEMELVERHYKKAVERQKNKRELLEFKYLNKKWHAMQTLPPPRPAPSQVKRDKAERAGTAPAVRPPRPPQ